MNRDKAIEIAAGATVDFNNDQTWATAVVSRADALLAAMGEPDTIAEHRECCEAQARITEAATEARVVREIAEWLRGFLDRRISVDLASRIKLGDWRAKEPAR